MAEGALRCTTCAVNWPTLEVDGQNVFRPCPECEGNVDWVNGIALKIPEAWSRKNHADFERYYAEREVKRLDPNWVESVREAA